MCPSYVVGDVIRSYRWLGHDSGYTELNALHPEYRPGDRAWNKEHHAYPVIAYLRSEQELLRFVAEYAHDHMVCYGLNPRPAVRRNSRGQVYSARETDISVSQNLVLDPDLQGTVTDARLRTTEELLTSVDAFFQDHGWLVPVRATTGRGYHLLCAYPPITIRECADLSARLREFRNEVVQEHQRMIDRLELVVDRTHDLRRLVRVYGTAKPTIGINSQFFGSERIEDHRLRDHLLQLKPAVVRPSTTGLRVHASGALPSWFTELLSTDREISALWHGTGKPTGTDQSSSGYDYTLVRTLSTRGYKNPDDLATILSHRPTSSAQRKGLAYLTRTIHNALHGM